MSKRNSSNPQSFLPPIHADPDPDSDIGHLEAFDRIDERTFRFEGAAHAGFAVGPIEISVTPFPKDGNDGEIDAGVVLTVFCRPLLGEEAPGESSSPPLARSPWAARVPLVLRDVAADSIREATTDARGQAIVFGIEPEREYELRIVRELHEVDPSSSTTFPNVRSAWLGPRGVLGVGEKGRLFRVRPEDAHDSAFIVRSVSSLRLLGASAIDAGGSDRYRALDLRAPTTIEIAVVPFAATQWSGAARAAAAVPVPLAARVESDELPDLRTAISIAEDSSPQRSIATCEIEWRADHAAVPRGDVIEQRELWIAAYVVLDADGGFDRELWVGLSEVFAGEDPDRERPADTLSRRRARGRRLVAAEDGEPGARVVLQVFDPRRIAAMKREERGALKASLQRALVDSPFPEARWALEAGAEPIAALEPVDDVEPADDGLIAQIGLGAGVPDPWLQLAAKGAIAGVDHPSSIDPAKVLCAFRDEDGGISVRVEKLGGGGVRLWIEVDAKRLAELGDAPSAEERPGVMSYRWRNRGDVIQLEGSALLSWRDEDQESAFASVLIDAATWSACAAERAPWIDLLSTASFRRLSTESSENWRRALRNALVRLDPADDDAREYFESCLRR
jgi:hypothetical protein